MRAAGAAPHRLRQLRDTAKSLKQQLHEIRNESLTFSREVQLAFFSSLQEVEVAGLQTANSMIHEDREETKRYFDREHRELRRAHTAAQEQVKTLHAALQGQIDTLKRISDENTQLVKEGVVRDEEVAALEDALAEMAFVVEQCKADRDQAVSQMADKQRHIEQLQDELLQLQEAERELRLESERQKLQITDMGYLVREVEERARASEAQAAKMVSQLESLQGTVHALKQENRWASMLAESTKNENKELRTELEGVVAERAVLKKQLSVNRRELDETRAIIKKMTSAAKKMRAAHRASVSNLSRVSSEADALPDNDALTELAQDLTKQLENRSTEVHELQSRNDRLESEMERLFGEVTRLTAAQLRTRTKLAETRDELDKARAEEELGKDKKRLDDFRERLVLENQVSPRSRVQTSQTAS